MSNEHLSTIERLVRRVRWRIKAQQLDKDNQGLRAETEQWKLVTERTNNMLISLVAEVQELRPLKVWAGHPCKHCKKPLLGVASREDAARLLEDFGHAECIKEHSGSGLGWLIAGGAAIAALSQTKKKS